MRLVWWGGWFGLLMTQSWAAMPVWQVARPIAGNPLVEASVAGRAAVVRQRAEASLAVACRADAPPASLSVRVPAKGLGFDLAPFEGPEGVGQHASLAKLYFGRERGRPVAVSGWRADAQHFQFSLHLPTGDVRQLLKANAVKLEVSAAGGKRGTLHLSFVLPENKQPLRQALAGCGV